MISPLVTISSVVAVLCSAVVFAFCKQPKKFHLFMGFTLAFDGLFLMLGGILQGGMSEYYAPIYLLYVAMMLISPFFYYFAIRFLLKEEGASKKDFWMLEVVVVLVAAMAVVGAVIPQSEKDLFIHAYNGTAKAGGIPSGTSALLALDNLAFGIFILEQIFIQIFCFLNLKKYAGTLEGYYSNLEGKSLGLITGIFVVIAVRVLLYIFFLFVPAADSSFVANLVFCILSCVFYVAVAVAVTKVKYTAEELAGISAPSQTKAPVANDIIKSRLAALIDEKFFLDPDIDLISLASKVQVNSKYVSEYIKFTYGETFMVFVNRLRVEHSQTLIAEGKVPLPDIPEQSGFISESTFYRNFIKVTGVSPAKFKKNA